MNKVRFVRRAAGVTIAMTSSLLGFFLCAPSAFALIVRPVGAGSSPTATPQSAPTTAHSLVSAGMAGWEVALIAVGAALFVATLAVITDRARASHRQVRVSAA